MTWRSPLLTNVAICSLVALVGCIPQQPFYLHEDGDLSHYIGKATEIDYPDVEEESLGEVDGAIEPFSLSNRAAERQIWDLSLQEAMYYALANNKVLRDLGGATIRLPGQAQLSRPGSLAMGSDSILRAPDIIPSVYDPALQESDPRQGVEAALSEFDAIFTTNVFWEKNDSPRNTFLFGNQQEIPAFPPVFEQDLGSFQAQLQKTAATGGTWYLRHNVQYDWQNASRVLPSDWNVNIEAEFRQPLLRGSGVQYNRIAGPSGVPGFYNGVEISRINTDIALTDFEEGVRNMVLDVEKAYWLLYFAYRRLDSMIVGRDSALETWRQTKTKAIVGTKGGDRYAEARARNQYFLFRSQVEGTLSELYAAESNLRYMMGLAATDGRLIRPKDQPTVARVSFDWRETLSEALVRSVELRRQKWRVKQRELELIASKNFLLPQVDANARYRWLGMGDDLIQSSGGTGDFRLPGSNAYQSMTNGKYQEWHLGIDFSMPIGFRQGHAGVRNAQLRVARERAVLQEAELEVSHQMAGRIRNLDSLYLVSQTNYNRRIAAKSEVAAAETSWELGREGWTFNEVLDAHRRLAEAEVEYYSTLVDYNTMIAEVHYRKGSLLEYNGVNLAEGPWPGKAYFDAHGRARQRDASYYLDYGFTRPKVISRGPMNQNAGQGATGPILYNGETDVETNVVQPENKKMEEIPAPMPEPIADPIFPQASTRNHGRAKAAATQLVARKKNAPTAAKRTHDIAKAASGGLPKTPATERLKPNGGWSVTQASFDQPATRSGIDVRKDRSGTAYEPLTNPSVVETYRPATGWKRLQR